MKTISDLKIRSKGLSTNDSKVVSKHHLNLKDVRRMARRPNQLVDVLQEMSNQLMSQSVQKFESSDGLVVQKLSSNEVLDQIICVFFVDQRLCHLVKLKDRNQCLVVDSSEVNTKWPEVVISFYENRLFFR